MSLDTNYILNVTTNYAYGRRKGYNDDECEQIAQATYAELELMSERYEKLQEAISALKGQSGECDGYIGCVVIDRNGRFIAKGSIFENEIELIEWSEKL